MTSFRCLCAVGMWIGLFAARPARAQDLIRVHTGGELTGASLAEVGDVNADGVLDYAIGAPGDDSAGPDFGRVDVHSGIDGSILFSVFGSFPGPGHPLGNFGMSVAGAGDVNADGHPDLIVGAPFDAVNGSDSGGAWVYSGAGGTLLHSFAGPGGSNLGSSVAGAGDVDADGHADLLMGGPNHDSTAADAGSAWIRSGASGAILHHLTGSAADDRLGSSCDGAGDMNGDGFADVLIGAPRSSGSGSVTAFSGRNGAILMHAALPYDSFGFRVASIDDVNADGVGDCVVGAPIALDGQGVVALVSGADGSTLGLRQGGFMERMGASVDGAGDVDGDAIEDVLVGTPLCWMGGGHGAAYVLSGSDAGVIYMIAYDLEIGGGLCGGFGAGVAGPGDLDGDGDPELLIGATGTHQAFLYSSTPAPIVPYCIAAPNSFSSEGARLSTLGIPSVASNYFWLFASGSVPTQTGLFYYGPVRIQLPFGDGYRCVAAGGIGLFRLYPVGTPHNGVAYDRLEFDALSGPGRIDPGSTWCVQFWYRDPLVGSGFNFSDALAITFSM